MLEIHNELLEKLHKFNAISVDICNNMKDIGQYNFNQDIQNYMNYDVINRHKLLIIVFTLNQKILCLCKLRYIDQNKIKKN